MRSIALAVLVSSALSACATLHPDPSASKITVDQFVAAVQDAINQTPDDKGALPGLKQVKLSLQTSTEIRNSVEVDYLVVDVKGYNDRQVSRELDLTLVKKPPPLLQAHLVPDDVRKALVDAINAAQAQVKRTYSRGGLELKTNEVDVQVSFVVTWDGAAGVGKWVLSPISLTAGTEVTSKTVHTVTICYADS